MDTLRTEHDINELKLQSLKAEVEKAVSPEPQLDATAGSHHATTGGAGAGGGSKVNIPIMDGQAQSSTTATATSSTTPTQSKQPSRSPVDLASQLFSRNKGKSSSKSKNKKSNSKGRTPPNGAATGNNNATQIDSLKSQVMKTQDDEMKLVSSAIGIKPDGDGQPLAEDGQDDVLDLADQLLAQLDAAKQEQSTLSHQSNGNDAAGRQPGIASGTASATTTAPTGLAAPTPINKADANLTSQNLTDQNDSSAVVEGGSDLLQAPSRQSVISSSNSAISSTSTAAAPPVTTTTSSSSRSRHSSSSSAPKPTSFGAKLKQALSPNSHRDRDDVSPSNITTGSTAESGGDVSPEPSTSTSPFSAQTFKNRHALRKEKKKQKEEAMRQEAQAEVEAERANGGVNNRYDAADLEKQGIDAICRSWNLELVEMEPDGHCMYSAIADQLTSKKVSIDKEKKMSKKERKEEKWDYSIVRKIAADYMRNHMDDFLPYLPAEDVEGQGEGLLSPEGYMKHCDNVENTSEWGSQTEVSWTLTCSRIVRFKHLNCFDVVHQLLALSKALELPIWVIQSRSPTVKIGTEEAYGKKKSPLMVTYHRVQYGLGEHYNSARVMPRESGMVYLG